LKKLSIGRIRLLRRKGNVKEEWNAASGAWVDFVREGKDHYRDGLNNPAAFKLIGNVKDKAVLDLACGEGYNTRILARKGAKVVGVDFSEKQIAFAKREEEKEELGIRYYVMEASDLKEIEHRSFDFVTCFMALQDIEDYEKAVEEVSRVLKNYGRFVFSIPHPCFETITVKGKRISPMERYFGIVKYPVHWDMKRLSKHFKTSSFRRTLTDYSAALHKNKLFISRLVEPKPTEKALKKYPRLRDTQARPQSIIIESTKILDS